MPQRTRKTRAIAADDDDEDVVEVTQTSNTQSQRSSRRLNSGSSSRRAMQVVDDEADDDGEEEEEEEDEDEDGGNRRSSRGGNKSYGKRGGDKRQQSGKSRGRKSRGGDDEDDEDDDPENIDLEDVEFDDEDGPQSRKSQMFKKLTQAVQDSDDEDDEEDELERQREKLAEWKAALEINHPIDFEMAKQYIDDLTKQIKDFVHGVNSTLTSMSDAAAALEENNSTGKPHPKVEKIDAGFRNLIDAQFTSNSSGNVLKRILEDIGKDDDEPLDPVEKYKSAMEGIRNAYSCKTSRQKYGENEFYENFRVLTWEAAKWRSSHSGMPSMKDLIPKEPGDPDDEDDDMEMGGVMQNYKCPITQSILDKPVKSAVCGHFYSKKPIAQHMAASRHGSRPVAVPCPVAGCDQKLLPADLKEDELMSKRVQYYQRRLAREEEERAKARATQAELIE